MIFTLNSPVNSQNLSTTQLMPDFLKPDHKADSPKAMKKLSTRASVLLTLIGLLGSPCAHSALSDPQSDYDNCLLSSLRDSRNEATSQILRRSCYALYQNGEMLLPRERNYHLCILQNLPGAREPTAISQILSICSRRGQM